MRISFLKLALAAAVLSAPLAASLTHPARAQAPAPETITLFQSDDRVLVMLTIGDHPPMPAVFDTGT
ncbi:hypothetical protein, partial [Brevundimonas nasdae]|uniref:hypothetical protein n=1 Tax=Brevundimonas nasdae TaxID=172043 RepID=UPI003F68EF7E